MPDPSLQIAALIALTTGQCIMKERPASERRSRMRRRLRCAALCRASLRYGGARE
jgi:hypothetical protein